MTTDMGKFVIDDGQTELVTIADVASAAAFSGVIIDALRGGLHVKYQQVSAVIQIGAPKATKPTPKSEPKPEPQAMAKAAKTKATKQIKLTRKPRVQRAARTTASEKLASILAKDPARQPTPTALVEVPSKWKQGDVVFLAWASMSELAKRTFAELCEAMGTVAEFRRGKGVKRTVGVQFDNANELVWLAVDELSDKCEYCIESQRRGVALNTADTADTADTDGTDDGRDTDLEDLFDARQA